MIACADVSRERVPTRLRRCHGPPARGGMAQARHRQPHASPPSHPSSLTPPPIVRRWPPAPPPPPPRSPPVAPISTPPAADRSPMAVPARFPAPSRRTLSLASPTSLCPAGKTDKQTPVLVKKPRHGALYGENGNPHF